MAAHLADGYVLASALFVIGWIAAFGPAYPGSGYGPGLFALGLPVLRRRKSTFLYGIEDDAREVIGELGGCLAGDSRVRRGRETAR